MPTGYTAYLTEEKELTFREFTLICARNFGALVTMRDEPMNAPIPEELKPSTYNKERLDEATKNLDAFYKLTPEELKTKTDEYNKEQIRYYEDKMKKTSLTRARYETMLKKVKDWNPPSSEHTGLKKFMIEQIERSIDFDCYDITLPKKLSIEQWKNYKEGTLLRDIEYHSKAYAEEIERTNGRNKWLKELRKSLEEV